jgi:hypothetical protein
MKRLRSKLTYANLVSTLCLFLLLGGGAAFAAAKLAKNSVGTKQIKNNAITAAKSKNGAVTGSKIKLSSLGTVPRATTADSATSAIHADSASSASTATTAANANALGGRAPNGYATTQLEAEHVVGKPGQPAFENGCTNFLPGDITEVGFYKDPFGVVHMRGYATGCTGFASIFTLPVGFRPKEGEFFAVVNSNSSNGLVEVTAEGKVLVFGGTTAGLSTVEFRTDG